MTADVTIKPKRARKPKAAEAPAVEVIPSYKGFDADLQCRGFQFEVGQTYEHDGPVKACSSGFHACEHPLDVFGYYPPASSRFAVVKQYGPFDRDGGDTKVASARISIDAEIRLPELIQAAVDWVFARAKWVDGPVATAANEAATASGTQGAATASGYEGRARGEAGNALFLVYRDPYSGEIEHAWAGIVGRDGIKPMTWYTLSRAGKPVEVGA
jgi:hypothetical protein